MFGDEPVLKSAAPKYHSSTKKIVVDTSYDLQGETGLNSVWRNFGEWIETGRNNKTQ